jgi:GNAT superfamily N-acetyltransferase
MRIEQLAGFDDERASRWYEAFRDGAAAGREAPLITPRGSQLASLAADATNPNRHREAWGAWEGSSCAGAMVVEWPLRENLHRAEIEVDVPPEHRGRGVGAALWSAGRDRAMSAGRRLLGVEISVPAGVELDSWPGGRFALARGYVAGHVEARLVLDLPDKSKMPDTAVGYRTLSFDGPIPSEWLTPLADLVNGMAVEVPTGELDVEAASWDAARLASNQHRLCSLGYALVTTVIVNGGGDAVAYSQMLVSGDEAHQEDTYVRPADRGHRLGTLAKARNLRALADWHPFVRRVHTWTAEINDPMRRINEAFGFRPVERVYALETRLGSRAE